MPPVRFSSVAQSCLTLCNPMECSAPGLPVHQQLPELAQNHVHRVGDAIQPSHPLSCPLAFSLSQHHGLFLRLVYLCKFLNIFIGVSLLYSVVLFSAVKQSESVIHIPPLFWIYFLFSEALRKKPCEQEMCPESSFLGMKHIPTTFLLYVICISSSETRILLLS